MGSVSYLALLNLLVRNHSLDSLACRAFGGEQHCGEAPIPKNKERIRHTLSTQLFRMYVDGSYYKMSRNNLNQTFLPRAVVPIFSVVDLLETLFLFLQCNIYKSLASSSSVSATRFLKLWPLDAIPVYRRSLQKLPHLWHFPFAFLLFLESEACYRHSSNTRVSDVLNGGGFI